MGVASIKIQYKLSSLHFTIACGYVVCLEIEIVKKLLVCHFAKNAFAKTLSEISVFENAFPFSASCGFHNYCSQFIFCIFFFTKKMYIFWLHLPKLNSIRKLN